MKCAVPGCMATHRNSPEFVGFHVAPAKKNIREQWFGFCCVPVEARKKLFVCSSHFDPECFQFDPALRLALTQDSFRKVLKRDAVPTICKAAISPVRVDKNITASTVSSWVNTMPVFSPPSPPFAGFEDEDCEMDFFKGIDEAPGSGVQRCSSLQDINGINETMAQSPETSATISESTDCGIKSVTVNVEMPVTVTDSRSLDDDAYPNGVQVLCDAIDAVERMSHPFAYTSHLDDTVTRIFHSSGVTYCVDGKDNLDSSVYSMESESDNVDRSKNDHSYALTSDQPDFEISSPNFSIVDELAHEQFTCMKLREELIDLQKRCALEQKQFKSAMRLKNMELNEKKAAIYDLRRACRSLQVMKEEETINRVKAVLSHILTPNQIDLLLGRKKRVNWTAEEIALSFTIRYHGQSVWNLLKKELHFPLPSIQTLRHWSSGINMNDGLLKDVLRIMHIGSGNMTDMERAVIISFDEVSVEATVEYDSKNDRIVGPHKNLQVVMARGLFSNWKQPIFAAFDTKMTLAILNEIITSLYDIGFTVVGIVSDCGGGNQGLWNECGIDIVKDHCKTAFQHPITKNDIYVFADAPHLLKLIRNWLLDDGFLYKGQKVTSKFLKALVSKASTSNPQHHKTEYNSLFKLSQRHILCNGPERQNVRLAAELLSHSTAVNLRRHFGDEQEAMLLAEIVEKVDLWFNTMNSYNLRENIDSKKCFGESMENQLAILDDMALLMASLRTLKKHQFPAARHVQVFQKGIMMSINSMKLLFTDMQRIYGVRFIMTYKLNQDLLENLFGQIRQNGGPNTHPSPLDALNRLRLIILGKGLSHQLTRNQNSQDILIQEDFVIRGIFKRAKIFVEDVDVAEEEEEEDAAEIGVQDHNNTIEEEDGFQYVMGFIARGLKNEHPELGSYTYQCDTDKPTTSCAESYVQDLSFGGLTQPSEQWLGEARKMDGTFSRMHNVENGNSGFRSKENVKKRTKKVLTKKFPHVSKKIIDKFTKAKINIRIRNMKKEIKEKKYLKAKLTKKPDDMKSAVTRKNAMKIKHFRN